MDSLLHHCHASTRPVSESAVRRHQVPIQIPSTMIAWKIVSQVGSAGRRSQHQDVFLRKDRPVWVPSISAWECFPVSQTTKLRSCFCLATSGRLRTEEVPQVGHRQRCVPERCFPFFTSFAPHSRHTVELREVGTVKGAGL